MLGTIQRRQLVRERIPWVPCIIGNGGEFFPRSLHFHRDGLHACCAHEHSGRGKLKCQNGKSAIFALRNESPLYWIPIYWIPNYWMPSCRYLHFILSLCDRTTSPHLSIVQRHRSHSSATHLINLAQILLLSMC